MVANYEHDSKMGGQILDVAPIVNEAIHLRLKSINNGIICKMV